MLKPGTTIGGLIIEDLLGQGGMGEVYRATQTSLSRPVAVKRIANHLTNDEQVVERFRREARIIARVNHPHILAVHDFSRMRDDDGDEHHLLVMELIQGGCSLREILRTRPSWQQATAIILQVCDGLAAVNELGIVHRDIKPDNIMLTKDGLAKLCDFGLAKAADSQTMTMSGSLLGTPAYLPPEAALGETCDHRSDLYSLGATWFHLLTGKPPFQARSTMQLIRAHCETPAPPTQGACPRCPKALAQIVDRCLRKDPHQRWSTASELAAAIRSWDRKQRHLPSSVPELLAALNKVPSDTLLAASAGEDAAEALSNAHSPTAQAAPAPETTGGRSKGILVATVVVVVLAIGLSLLVMPTALTGDAPTTDDQPAAPHDQAHTNSPDEPPTALPILAERTPNEDPEASAQALPDDLRLALELAEIDLERGLVVAGWQRIAELHAQRETLPAAGQERLETLVSAMRARAKGQRAMLYAEILRFVDGGEYGRALRLLENQVQPYAELFAEQDSYQRLQQQLRQRLANNQP